MKFLSAFMVLVFVVGVYCNCGCLKCNKDLKVYSPRGSSLKLIYRHSPCNCLSSLPYSVQVPVQPLPSDTRLYGYQIREANVEHEPIPCPIPHEYNVQVQVPVNKPPPSYLVGLVAKTDRVLIPGPPELQPAPGCPRPIIEPVQLIGQSEEDSADNYWYYPPSCGCRRYAQKIRFPKVLPLKSPQITPNTPLINVQLLQRHSYTPPRVFNSNQRDLHDIHIIPSSELTNQASSLKRRQQLNYNFGKQEENPQISALKCRERFQVVRVNPNLIRIYRQVFCQPSQKNSESFNFSKRSRNSVPNKRKIKPVIYRQVLLESRPEIFRVILNSKDYGRKNVKDSDLQHQTLQTPLLYSTQIGKENLESLNLQRKYNSDLKIEKVKQNSGTDCSGIFPNSFQKMLESSSNFKNNSSHNFQASISKNPNSGKVYRKRGDESDAKPEQTFPEILPTNPKIGHRNLFPKNFKGQTSESDLQFSEPKNQNSANSSSMRNFAAKIFKTSRKLVREMPNYEEIQQNHQHNRKNKQISDENVQNFEANLHDPVLKSLLKVSTIDGKYHNFQKPHESFKLNSSGIKIMQNFNVKKNHVNSISNSKSTAENFQKIANNVPDNFNVKGFNKRLSLNSAQNQTENFAGRWKSMENVHHAQKRPYNLKATKNFTATNSPKNYHMMNSQHLVLTEENSVPKTIFLSTAHHFSTNFNPIHAESKNSIFSKNKNRPRRSINWKLLALKPENPPRYLRMHNSAPKHSLNNENLRMHHFSPGHFPNNGHGEESSRTLSRLHHRDRSRRPHAHAVTHGIKSSHHFRKTSRFPRDNKKNKIQLKKKKNNIKLKSSLKRTNKIIKDWFSKESPLNPPEIQLPNYIPESTNVKSWFVDDDQNQKPSKKRRVKLGNLDRHKRAIRIKDESILPFFTLSDDSEEMGKETIKGQKYGKKLHNSKPTEAFLEPFNFNHILHPTPLLHLLNAPIRYLNHVHQLRSHVSPVVSTIPKVIQVSRRYVIDLLRNLGKSAIHLGTNFIKGFTKVKRSKILPKRRHKRSLELSEYLNDDVEDNEHHNPHFSSDGLSRRKEHRDNARDQWEAREKDDEEVKMEELELGGERNGEQILRKNEDWENKEGTGYSEDEIVDKILSKFVDEQQVQGMFGKLGDGSLPNFSDDEVLDKDRYANVEFTSNRRRKRDVDTSNGEQTMTKTENAEPKNNILMDLLRFFMSLGTPNENPEKLKNNTEKIYSDKTLSKEDSIENNNLSEEKERKKREVEEDNSPITAEKTLKDILRYLEENETQKLKNVERFAYSKERLFQKHENNKGFLSQNRRKSKYSINDNVAKSEEDLDQPRGSNDGVIVEENANRSENGFTSQNNDEQPQDFLINFDKPNVFLINSYTDNEEFVKPKDERDGRADFLPQDFPGEDFSESTIKKRRRKRAIEEADSKITMGKTEIIEKEPKSFFNIGEKVVGLSDDEEVFPDDTNTYDEPQNLHFNSDNTGTNIEVISEVQTVENSKRKRRALLKPIDKIRFKTGLEGKQIDQILPIFSNSDSFLVSSGLPKTSNIIKEAVEFNNGNEENLNPKLSFDGRIDETFGKKRLAEGSSHLTKNRDKFVSETLVEPLSSLEFSKSNFNNNPTKRSKEESDDGFSLIRTEDYEKQKPLDDIQNKILKVTEEAKEILAQSDEKLSYPFELDVQVQTIKNKIAETLTNTQTIINYDLSNDLQVHQNLLKLQNLKLDIIQKWKSLTFSNKLEEAKNELINQLTEAQDLKDSIFHEIVQIISKQESIFTGSWIKTLLRLQKLHCILKNLNQRLGLGNNDYDIGFLENLHFIDGKTQEEILTNLQKNQEGELERQICLLENLKTILDKGEDDKTKEEARTIWEINNVQKLQKISILELNQKIAQGLKIRKELKILFDLEKQLEKCEEKQKTLMNVSGKNI